jgi:hypothetical protein
MTGSLPQVGVHPTAKNTQLDWQHHKPLDQPNQLRHIGQAIKNAHNWQRMDMYIRMCVTLKCMSNEIKVAC